MFSIRGVSRYKILKNYVRERRRLYSPSLLHNIEDTLVQTLCWTDPYAMLTITNYPSLSIYRLICELFFDQQAHSFVHSSDFLSMMVLVILLRLKSDMLHEGNKWK